LLLQDPTCETWATGIDGQHVEWMAQHLGKRLIPVHTTVLPSLPLADDHLDLVLAYSVLTHIDVLETAWLAETRRVLQPGGVALVTVHTERSWELLEPGLGLYRSLLDLGRQHQRDRGERGDADRTDAGAPRCDELAHIADVYNSVVFHSQKYIRDRWSRYFDVVDIIDEASEYQAVVVLRVPVSRS
jgi:SAM-dependent methyltransferase